MLDDRIGELPKNKIISVIKELERLYRQLRAAQFSGADSVRMSRVFTANAYDLQLNNVGFVDGSFWLIFTPHKPNTIAYKMEFKIVAQDTTNQLFFDNSVERQKVNTETGEARWLIVPQGSDFYRTSYAQFKFYVWASGGGTLTTQMV